MTSPRAAPARGVSLVELMVGIAVGLMVLAAATTVVTSQLGSTRRLLLETQLDQDLRTAGEIISRELRRTNSTMEDRASQWFREDQLGVNWNDATAPVISGTDNSQIEIFYRRAGGEERTGFKLEGEAIKVKLGDGSWHELTDPQTVKITRFSIGTARTGGRAASRNSDAHIVPCPFQCPGGGTACWPRMVPVEYTITIAGELRRDSSFTRTLTTSVAVRSARMTLPEGTMAPGAIGTCPVEPG